MPAIVVVLSLLRKPQVQVSGVVHILAILQAKD